MTTVILALESPTSACMCLQLCGLLKKNITKDPMFLPTRAEEKKRTSHEETSMEDEIYHFLFLAQSYYVVSGSVGLCTQMQVPMTIVIGNGSGHNFIRRSSLPDG